jgi:hypothetical protein
MKDLMEWSTQATFASASNALDRSLNYSWRMPLMRRPLFI